jgi:hypothetical protein
MKKVLLPILITALIFISGCTFYKQIPVTEITKESITTLKSYKPIVLFSNGVDQTPYVMTRIQITNDSIRGYLSVQPYYTNKIYSPTVTKSNLPQASNILYLQTSSTLAEGDAVLALNNLVYGNVYEKDVAKSAAGTAGVAGGSTALVGVAVVGAIILFTVAVYNAICNCPYVAIINPDGTESFQGSLFPGSIFKMLKRRDNLVLSNQQKAENGLMEIKVYNELEEVQYIDNVELLGINHSFNYLGLNQENELIAFNQGELPIAAKAQNGVDVLTAITKRDDVDYNFDEVGTDEQLNSLELTFNTKNIQPNAQLVIRAQQSKWLEQTAEVFFQQFGTYFPKWVNEMNDGDASKYNQNTKDQGISLNAYAKKNGKWEYIGSYQNVGTVAKRDITLPIDLSSYGEQVEIKLECAHAFWDVDQVSLTDEWKTDLQTTSFSIASAVNEKGEIVKDIISETDNKYVTQERKGTFTTINFEVPQEFEGSLVLNANGYYNHVRDYTTKPNRKFLKEMKKTELSTHQLSRTLSLYSQLQLANN